MQINVQKFEKHFYSTMEKDLMKFRDIWIDCSKPNPHVRTNEKNRARASAMAASALHMIVKLPKKNISLQLLMK